MARTSIMTPQAPSRAATGPMVPNTRFLGTLQHEVDRLFEDFSRAFSLSAPGIASFMPSIDINEKEDAIEVVAELPGLEAGDVEIALEDNLLTIRGEKQDEREEGDGTVRLRERVYGTFLRTIELPKDVDPAAVQATMSNGVLRLRVPKAKQSGTKKIEVKQAA